MENDFFRSVHLPESYLRGSDRAIELAYSVGVGNRGEKNRLCENATVMILPGINVLIGVEGGEDDVIG